MHEARVAVYRELWGEPATVIREPEPRVPHVEIHVYAPGMDHNGIYERRYTLVTAGRSEMPMTFPPG